MEIANTSLKVVSEPQDHKGQSDVIYFCGDMRMKSILDFSKDIV